MSKIFECFLDKAKTITGYPKTLTKAVYDDNGNRLDNTLTALNENLGKVFNADYITDANSFTPLINKDIYFAPHKANTANAADTNWGLIFGAVMADNNAIEFDITHNERVYMRNVASGVRGDWKKLFENKTSKTVSTSYLGNLALTSQNGTLYINQNVQVISPIKFDDVLITIPNDFNVLGWWFGLIYIADTGKTEQMVYDQTSRNVIYKGNGLATGNWITLIMQIPLN